jgi:hypothetical protein
MADFDISCMRKISIEDRRDAIRDFRLQVAVIIDSRADRRVTSSVFIQMHRTLRRIIGSESDWSDLRDIDLPVRIGARGE